MNPHVNFLVVIHYAAALLVGVPAACGAVFFGWQVWQIFRNPLPPIPAPTTSKDGLMQIFSGVERGLAAIFRPLASLNEFIMEGLLALSIVALVFAVVFGLTGRGLSHGAGWARLIAGCAWLTLTVIALLSQVALSGVLVRLAGASCISFGIYGIWVLITGFKVK